MLKTLTTYMVLLSLFIFANLPAFSGTERRNGGDTIYCFPTDNSNLFGYYSVDYLLFLLEGGEAKYIESWKVNLTSIQNRLVTVAPNLAKDLKEFISLIHNNDYSKKIVWEGSNQSLIELPDEEITDEELIKKIPKNCSATTARGRTYMQSIIRENISSNLIIFHYDTEHLKHLKRKPLQYSFLMIHEWLWRYFKPDEIKSLRKINGYFHSIEFVKDNNQSIRKNLIRFGLVL